MSLPLCVVDCTDLAYNSDSTWKCSACWCWRLWQTVLDETGILRVWIQDLPDHPDQVHLLPYMHFGTFSSTSDVLNQKLFSRNLLTLYIYYVID